MGQRFFTDQTERFRRRTATAPLAALGLACAIASLAVFGYANASSPRIDPASIRPVAIYHQEQYHIEAKPVQRVQATLTDSYALPDIYAKEWTIYAPDAPDTDDQRGVFSKMDVMNRQCSVATWSELSPLSRPLLQAQLIDDGQTRGAQLSTKIVYTATLNRRELVPGPPTLPVAPISPDDRRAYTRASETIDYVAQPFQAWLDANDLRRQASERDLDFALRVFEFIRQTYQYNYDLSQDRRASVICQTTQTDCGGLSQLFVATLRASGVPAMALCGRIARSTSNPGDHGNCHVKSQFYAAGIGWVPVEMSGATYDKTAPYWVYFGRTYGDFLTLSIDNDQQLVAGHYGVKNQRGLQGFRFWVWGTQGSADNIVSSTDWNVQQLPLTTYGSRLAEAKN